MSFGKRLKRLRIESGRSQKEIAKDLQISNVTLSQYESDTRKPDIETLKTIADYFRVSTDFLLYEIKPKNQLDDEIDQFTTPDEAMRFILEQNVIMGYGGFNINDLNEEEILEFANELLAQLRLVSYKYKK